MKEQDLRAEFVKATHRFKRLSLGNLFEGISKGEFFTLKMISHKMKKHGKSNGIYVSELAGELKVTSPAVSRMLRTLEEKELIERNIDKDDRRNTYVALTQKGEATMQKAEKLLSDFADRVFEKMGIEEVEKMIHQWNKMADIMEVELEKIAKGDEQ